MLANPKSAFVQLDSPEIIIAAMLGDLGVQMKIGVPPGLDNPPVRVFSTGGKMVDHKHRTPQNTTFSSVIVLGQYPLREKLIFIGTEQKERALGRKLEWEELKNAIDACPVSEQDQPVRVVAYENPFRRIALPEEIFQGAFDEQWRKDGDRIRRVYVGKELQQIEAELAKCDQRSPLQRWIERKRENDAAKGVK